MELPLPGNYYRIITSVNSAGNYSYRRQNCIRKQSNAVSCVVVHLTLVRSGCSAAAPPRQCTVRAASTVSTAA